MVEVGGGDLVVVEIHGGYYTLFFGGIEGGWISLPHWVQFWRGERAKSSRWGPGEQDSMME